MTVHPIVARASEGTLPDWSVAGPARREHMTRVAGLLDGWARGLALADEARARWRAAGHLHDCLRDEDPGRLRERVPPGDRRLPGALLHGPAASERLRVDGVLDGELLRAVAYHTVGDADFGLLGRALYAADFLEPGRSFLAEWRSGLRARMPDELGAVVREIARARLIDLVERGLAVPARSVGFWNRLAEEGA